MFITLLLVSAALLFLYSWMNKRPKGFPPGPPCLPLVGSAPYISSNNFHFQMLQWKKQYGPLVGLVLGSQPVIAAVDAKVVMEVLRHEDFQGRPELLSVLERTFNEKLGVFFSDGAYWVEQRRFTLRHLKEFGFGKKSMEGLILEEAEQTLKDLKQYKSKPIQVSMLFTVPIVNVLWAVMSGTRYDRDDKEFQNMLDKLNHLFRSGNPSGGGIENIIPPLRYLLPTWRKTMKSQAEIHGFMRKSIRDHEKTFDSDNMRDFIDVYIREMQNGTIDSTFTEKSLISICSDLFSAGAESVSNTLGFCLMYLVTYPEIQQAVHDEIEAVIGSNRRPSLDDKIKLPYVEAFLQEVMRLNPIAPLAPPHRATKDTTFRGYHIPKDTMLFINLWSCFQDIDHWGDPEVFRPERFIGSDGKFIKDEFMINFGLGKRVCLGESLARNSLFLFFTTIMQDLTFKLPQGDDVPSTIPLSGFTVAPAPFEVIATERL